MEALNICYQLLFILCYIAFFGANSDQNSTCAPGLLTAGVTVPKGDIKIEYGNPLEIFCILDPHETHLNSSYLVFYHNNVKVRDEFLTIVNETTLRLFVKKPPISDSLYSCKLRTKNKEEGVCLNYVYVGTKPQPVNNFTCISYNWEGLNCSWIPVKNPVHTTYRLSFSLRGKSRHIFKCPGDSDISHNYCLWNSTTNPPHRMPYAEYFLNLIGENVLGNITTKIKINHFAVVLPRKPENLTLVQSTPSSLTISWDLPLALKEFPVEIKNKVLYQSRWDPMTYWQEVDTSKVFKNGEQRVLNITGLKYAHTLYDIRVLLRSSQAEDIDKWWSEPATITIRTKPTVPAMPPKTVIGSFESTPRASDSDHRNIFIYWQLIPQKLENGENFAYNISSIEEIVDGKRVLRNNTPAIHKYYALFEKMTYNTYIFKIVSSNKEGTSQNYSTIVVPSKAGSPDHPVSFTKIAYDHGVYALSWNAPPQNNVSSHNDITSYTIFWCDNKYDRPYGCNGVLNWTIVSNNVTEKNITLTVDKTYQFAISANTANSSSGMMWAHCTVFPDQERGKLKNIWINRIGSNFMELGWKLECIRSPINGFEVEYCPVPFPKQSECKEVNRKRFKGDQYASRYNISGLQPYTTYMVRLSLVSVKDSLISSDALLNTTLEAAPDGPPENFKALTVTNNSVTLSWKPPSALNGVLRHYEIYWNSSYTLIENKSQVVQFTLRNLASYEDYIIRVTACTVACSNKSATLVVRTKIGTPAQLNTPAVTYYNKTDLNITWFPLKSRRGGRNDFYQIKVEMLNEQKDTVLNETIKRYNNTSGARGKEEPLEILIPGCQEAESSAVYRVQVRAVNEDNENFQLFKGPWSLPAEGFCHATSALGLSFPSMVVISSVGILLLLVLCAITGLMTRYIWMRCKAMQNIRVKLPPQLELDNEIYKNNKLTDLPMNAHVCPQLKPLNSDSSDNPPPDQQLLLEKKDKEELGESSTEDGEDASGERESSGCGSGQESVSSSISSGTHITDSGTEADEVSMFAEVGGHQRNEMARQQEFMQRLQRPEDVFSDSPRREYRQRNVSRSGSGGEGYCILAQAPSGYVSLPPISNYVKHDWTPNAPIKGYDMNGSVASPNAPSARPPSNETSWAT